MEKKSSEFSVQEKQIKENVNTISDEQIDYSDIPELTDEELKKFKRVGQALKDVEFSSTKKS